MTKITRDLFVRLRMTEAEKAAWEQAADAAGLALSEWIRRRVNGGIVEVPPAPAKPAAPKPKRPRSK